MSRTRRESLLDSLNKRIERLRQQGAVPIEIIMSPETWEDLKREHRARFVGRYPKLIPARVILGARNKLVPGTTGCVIRYFGGMDFPPDQAGVGGKIDGPLRPRASQQSPPPGMSAGRDTKSSEIKRRPAPGRA